MEKLIINLITAIIGNVDSSINKVFNNLIDMCFNAEQYLINILDNQIISFTNLKAVILTFAISLIVLKFLKKGFDTYILWTEGDHELPPLVFITYFARALILAITFPILYDWLIVVSKDFANDVLISLNVSSNIKIINELAEISAKNIFNALFGIVLMILMLLLYIQFIIRGVEMFVLKVGFPLACVGLIDSDKGLFAPYIKKFFQCIVTVIVQIALTKLTILLIASGQMIQATAVALVALRTPKFLSEFMLVVNNGGTGMRNVATATSKVIEVARKIRGRG